MFKKLLSSQLRMNMGSGVLTTIVNTLVMMVGYPVYLHFLSYEKYGLWLVLSVVLTFAQLGNLGIGPAVTKLVAEEYGRGNIEGVKRYVTMAVLLLCLSGSVVLLGILVFRGPIVAAFKLTQEDAIVVSSLIPYVGVLSIYVFIIQVLNGTLSGLGRMDQANVIETAGRMVSIGTTIVLLYAGLGIRSMLIGSAVAYFAKHIFHLVCIYRVVHTRLFRAANLDLAYARRLLQFGTGVFGGSLISMLFNPFNKLMLTRYAGVATVPIYEIAFTGASQVRALIDAALRPLMPEISRLGGVASAATRVRIRHLYRRATNMALCAGIPTCVMLTLFSRGLLKLWLGEQFVQSLPTAFRIMIGGIGVSLIAVPAYYVLMGMGYVRYIFMAHAIQVVINLLVVSTFAVTSMMSASSVVTAVAVAMLGVVVYLRYQTSLVLCNTSDSEQPEVAIACLDPMPDTRESSETIPGSAECA